MIEWNRVTWYSQLTAIILALIILGVGFWLGRQSGQSMHLTSTTIEENQSVPSSGQDSATSSPSSLEVNDATYTCTGGKTIEVFFKPLGVEVWLDGKSVDLAATDALPDGESGWANANQSIIFETQDENADSAIFTNTNVTGVDASLTCYFSHLNPDNQG